ncbi:unnamed protein product, partial [Laminaria digitata]
VGPPCWATGLACPAFDGLDPAKEARALLLEASESVLRGSPITVGVVDDVFSLVQLALDDRTPTDGRSSADGGAAPAFEAEKAFRSALAPGALGLVAKLAAALQPRRQGGSIGPGGVGAAGAGAEGQCGGSGGGKAEGGLRDAVVLTARYLSAMEQLVAGRNNTSALLTAHNGLAKLLKGRW